MAKLFTCERDGFVMRGKTDDELAAKVERHIAEAHPDLVGKLSHDDILAEIRAKATEDARQAAEQSLRPYQAKGIVPLAERARALLAEIPA
jgi:predicted small metal-binding protein